MVILDTSIIIDHIRQSNLAVPSLMERVVAQADEQIAISMITIQELYAGKSTKNPQQEEKMINAISPLIVLPYTYEIAELAGKISRDSSLLIEFPDAAIAATSILNNAPLATLNTKHFQEIPALELVL